MSPRPSMGPVALVNVEADDIVTEDSQVIEVVDPTAVEVVSLVDAGEVGRVAPGASARIVIDGLDGRELDRLRCGLCLMSPRTETRRCEVPRHHRSGCSGGYAHTPDVERGIRW